MWARDVDIHTRHQASGTTTTTTTTTTTRLRQVGELFFSVLLPMDESSVRPSAGGVAMRRRQRRLRSMLRHEQQSIRMALAATLHHSSGKVHAEYGAPRGLKTATTAGEEEHKDKHDAPRRQKPPPPQLELFQLYEEEGTGSAAHRGADHRVLRTRADGRRSCAADVILQLKFQQSFVVSVDVPQIPFIDRVVDISVASQRLGPQCLLCRRPEIPWWIIQGTITVITIRGNTGLKLPEEQRR